MAKTVKSVNFDGQTFYGVKNRPNNFLVLNHLYATDTHWSATSAITIEQAMKYFNRFPQDPCVVLNFETGEVIERR